MNRAYALAAGVTIGSVLWVMTGLGRAEGEDKAFLPADAYKELVAREVKSLQESLKGSPNEEQLARAKLAAVMIARLALDTKAEDAAGVENAALQIAKLLGGKDQLAAARKLAASLSSNTAAGKLTAFDAKPLVGEVMDTMNHLRQKKKGGDGMHPDLQTSGPLKNLNGIEEKIRSLAKKKLTDAALKKSASEMVLLGYRTAVLADVVNDLAPAQKTKLWRDFSAQMRAASIRLAQASRKRDADAIFKAASSLEASCTSCHSEFKN